MRPSNLTNADAELERLDVARVSPSTRTRPTASAQSRAVGALRRHWLPLTAAAFVTALYLLPHMIQASRGYGGAMLIQEDEPFYVARFARALQGTPSASPLIYEHRDELSILPGFVERALAAPFRGLAALGVTLPSAAAIVTVYRALFTFIGVLCMSFAFTSVGMGSVLATLATLWAYVDPGLLFYKPLLGAVITNQVFDRFPNPAVSLPILFFGWGSVARVVLSATPASSASAHLRTHARWVASAGISGGLLFYISFYYWTLFIAVLALTALIDLRRLYAAAIAVGALALVVSAGYWLYAIEFRSSPLYTDVLWRTDFLAHGRGVSFKPNRTMWFFLGLAATAWRLGTPQARFLVLSSAGGLACFYSGLFTGLAMPNSLENGHWNVSFAPMVFAACLWSVADWFSHSRFARWQRPAGYALTAVLCASGIVNFSHVSREVSAYPLDGAGALDPAYTPAWRWLREHAPNDAVVLASDRTMAHVPLQAGKFIWVHRLVYPDPISFEEILDRNRVLWALQGQSAPDIHKLLMSHWAGPNTWFWGWGLTHGLVEELKADGWPPLDALRWRLFSSTIRDVVAQTTAADVKAIGQRYRLDYIVRGPLEQGLSQLDRYLQLQTVFEEHGVRVDRVEGWR